jgi:hypothetical protein
VIAVEQLEVHLTLDLDAIVANLAERVPQAAI